MNHAVNPLRSRLCWRIAGLIFAAIIFIEIIILVPSYLNRERELIDQKEAVALSAVRVFIGIFSRPGMKPEHLNGHETLNIDGVLGATLVEAGGEILFAVGEQPVLGALAAPVDGVMRKHSHATGRHDIGLIFSGPEAQHTFALRLDTSRCRKQSQGLCVPNYGPGGDYLPVHYLVCPACFMAVGFESLDLSGRHSKRNERRLELGAITAPLSQPHG